MGLGISGAEAWAASAIELRARTLSRAQSGRIEGQIVGQYARP
jgi:hypothetical protein